MEISQCCGQAIYSQQVPCNINRIPYIRVMYCSRCKRPCFTQKQAMTIEEHKKIRYEELDGIRPVGSNDGILRGSDVNPFNKCRINEN